MHCGGELSIVEGKVATLAASAPTAVPGTVVSGRVLKKNTDLAGRKRLDVLSRAHLPGSYS